MFAATSGDVNGSLKISWSCVGGIETIWLAAGFDEVKIFVPGAVFGAEVAPA
jgi:hypothetical protein